MRTKEISEEKASVLLDAFLQDSDKYSFIPFSEVLLSLAGELLNKYGRQSLRTLDSIQLATAVSLKEQVQLFVCSDKLLRTFMKQEQLPVH